MNIHCTQKMPGYRCPHATEPNECNKTPGSCAYQQVATKGNGNPQMFITKAVRHEAK